MRKLTFCLALLFFVKSSFSQNSFYANDSISKVGVNVINYGSAENAKFCHIQKDSQVIKYGPYEITAYGIKDKAEYVAREIQVEDSIKKVFLEVLSKGSLNLYYYIDKSQKSFFVETNKLKLTQLPTRNELAEFHKILDTITADCEPANKSSKLAKYNRNSLRFLINQYNDCSSRQFPITRFGVFGGLTFTKFTKSKNSNLSYIQDVDMNYNSGLSLGFFIDRPIASSNTSLNFKLFYSQNKMNYTKSYNTYSTNLDIKTSAINIPFMVRYTFPTLKKQFYLNGGGVYIRHLKNESTVINNTTNNMLTENKIISDKMYGIALGTGIQFTLNHRQYTFIEFLWTNGLKSGDYLDKQQFCLIAGISF